MLKEIIFTLLVAGCVVAFPQAQSASIFTERHGRIVGGRDATMEEFPFVVAVVWFGVHYCGGAILNVNTVLSAAQCTGGFPVNGFGVYAGSNKLLTGGQFIGLSRIIEHPSFSTTPMLINDIVILKLERNLVLSAAVRPIQLPVADLVVLPGSLASVTGWGAINTHGNLNPTVLQTLNTHVIGNAHCTTLNNIPTRPDQLCAGAQIGRDTCDRDEGAPLVFNGRLIGLVSWGLGPGCAVGRPVIYTRVSSFLSFIIENLQDI